LTFKTSAFSQCASHLQLCCSPLSSVLAIAINLLKEHVIMDKMDSNLAHTQKRKRGKVQKKKGKT